MRTLIVASNNKHKIIEIKELLKGFKLKVLSLKDAGIDIDVEETGKTFSENAYIKAAAIKELSKEAMILSDDSGLMVEYLDGAPGVYSARFAGEHGDSEKNNQKLLKLLKDVPREKRGAKFVCSMVLIDGDKVISVEGESKGIITEDYEGHGGFGYDPLFFVEEFNGTYAEITQEQKNSISHRGRAMELLKMELKNNLV
ncbi:MAG: XTP/dITP diphosphatase [Clostridium sp.]